ncbi:hypothetical protein H105_00839 [Trichophyton soudanense CBS 452.61]|uniref:Uncharacterized protein n=1 Tax=Trichophyton soudanense CBS 452.61 TaxID=1215331 RepID=A0A022Y6U9_TRISD|nr:hypothetical protein H105_00839 [Trichophyton soudanense CBS 452.61]EZG10589.1 hypothetical protein H106_00638 [Trichophyton rubrum CBS 735.88]
MRRMAGQPADSGKRNKTDESILAVRGACPWSTSQYIIQRAAGETRGRSTLKCATQARQNYESQGNLCASLSSHRSFLFFFSLPCPPYKYSPSLLCLVSPFFLSPFPIYISHPRLANNSCTRAHTKSRTSKTSIHSSSEFSSTRKTTHQNAFLRCFHPCPGHRCHGQV